MTLVNMVVSGVDLCSQFTFKIGLVEAENSTSKAWDKIGKSKFTSDGVYSDVLGPVGCIVLKWNFACF